MAQAGPTAPHPSSSARCQGPAEAALKAQHGKHTPEPEAFEAALQAIVEQHRVAGRLPKREGKLEDRTPTEWLGRGRPGPNRAKQNLKYYRARVLVGRRAQALQAFKQQAGWRPYATNAPKARLSLQQAVEKYCGQ